jgi:hypothetical protein
VLVLDKALALERIIARATDPGVPEQFALGAPAGHPPLPWIDAPGDGLAPLAPWLRHDAPRAAPVLVAAPMP